MTTTAKREKLHDLIRDADDEKIDALYLVLGGDEVATPYDWSQNKEFVAALDEEYSNYEKGIDKGITLEELEASLELPKQPYGAL